MAGHSHWANISRKKSLIDNKRGKVWSKLARNIIVAAKGGGDPDANLKLRYAIDAAKAVSMPKDNITRAIKKGTGELEGGNLEEVLYEGYGPGGVAVLCEIFTDNRNRTAGEIRKYFELAEGKLGATGCVAWMFDRKGLFLVPAAGRDEEELLEIALEAGADEVEQAGTNFEITCDPANFQQVLEKLKERGVTTELAEITRIPKDTVDLDADTARKVLKLMEKLDDHDDVQAVASNFNIPDDAMAEIGGGVISLVNRSLANKAKVVVLCIGAACTYGVLHDQITVRVCLEYFTVAHPPLFPVESPTLLALCWGVGATVGIGFVLGLMLAQLSQSDGRSPYPLRSLCRSVGILLGLMALSALTAGCVGYWVSSQILIAVPESFADAIPASRHSRFMTVWFAHVASYLVGLGGGAWLYWRVWNARGRPRAMSMFPRSRVAVVRALLIALALVAAIWIRFGSR